ncbi:phage holin [Escherichia coli]|uniref:phage holin n=1 Tax=Escherichia coli TaxID=562 RepID=UPI0038CBF45A
MWWTPLCLIRQILTRRFRLYAYAAIGVLGSLVFGLLTYLTNLYFKIKEDRRKVARRE